MVTADSEPAVSVIIVSARDGRRLKRCLSTLTQATPDVGMQVILVLNAADPDVADVAASHPLVDEIETSPHALGFAAATNLGRRRAIAPTLFLLHDDAVVHHGALRCLLDTLGRHPKLGACGPLVLADDGSVESAQRVVFADGRPWHVGKGDPPSALGASLRALPSDYCGTNALAVRAEAWDDVGGLEEAYFPVGYSDVDLAFSLRRRGWVVWFDPDAIVTHDGNGGSSFSHAFRSFCHERNRKVFVGKWADYLVDHEPQAHDDLAGSVARAAVRAAARKPVRGPLPSAPPAPQADALTLVQEYALQMEAELAACQQAERTRESSMDATGELRSQLDGARNEIERLRRCEETLDAILAGGWWRLRERLQPLLKPMARVRGRRRH